MHSLAEAADTFQVLACQGKSQIMFKGKPITELQSFIA